MKKIFCLFLLLSFSLTAFSQTKEPVVIRAADARIEAGQTVLLMEYVVREGDTLYSIGKTFGLTGSALENFVEQALKSNAWTSVPDLSKLVGRKIKLKISSSMYAARELEFGLKQGKPPQDQEKLVGVTAEKISAAYVSQWKKYSPLMVSYARSACGEYFMGFDLPAYAAAIAVKESSFGLRGKIFTGCGVYKRDEYNVYDKTSQIKCTIDLLCNGLQGKRAIGRGCRRGDMKCVLSNYAPASDGNDPMYWKKAMSLAAGFSKLARPA